MSAATSICSGFPSCKALLDHSDSGGRAPMATVVSFDAGELESKVKAMYRDVAEKPPGKYHFEMGRGLAERLGYLHRSRSHSERIDRLLCRCRPLFSPCPLPQGRERRRPGQSGE